MGKITTLIVFINKPRVLTSMINPVSSSDRDSIHNVVRSGVKITASRVETVVKLTESAT